MRKLSLSNQQIADLIMSFIGEIEPVGETNTDDRRYHNLSTLTQTIDCLLDEIYWLCPYTTNDERSMQRAGKKAERWLDEKRYWLNEIFASDKDLIDRRSTMRALNILGDKMSAEGQVAMQQAVAVVESMESELC